LSCILLQNIGSANNKICPMKLKSYYWKICFDASWPVFAQFVHETVSPSHSAPSKNVCFKTCFGGNVLNILAWSRANFDLHGIAHPAHPRS
jgi:hypothetical protein